MSTGESQPLLGGGAGCSKNNNPTTQNSKNNTNTFTIDVEPKQNSICSPSSAKQLLFTILALSGPISLTTVVECQ
jgi:hypothetical protein